MTGSIAAIGARSQARSYWSASPVHRFSRETPRAAAACAELRDDGMVVNHSGGRHSRNGIVGATRRRVAHEA
jgi:hypothetical protein